MRISKYITLIILLVASPVFADYYVDNTASGTCNNGDTDYYPSTRSCGSGSDTIYLSLGYADQARDWSGLTINVRGGTYTSDIFVSPTGTNGTLKNYNSESVTMTGVDNGSYPPIYVTNNGWTIDGLILDSWTGSYCCELVYFEGADNGTIKNLTISNISGIGAAIKYRNGSYFLIDNNNISSVTTSMEGSDVIWLGNAHYGTVSNNVINEPDNVDNHGSIGLYFNDNSNQQPCSYIKITGNTITNYEGGGIYIDENSTYNLAENNSFRYIGYGQSAYPKEGIQLSGSYNTVRNNTFFKNGASGYEGGHRSICLSSYYFQVVQLSQYNNIYNNTIYGHVDAAPVEIQESGGSSYHANNNVIANNLIYYSPQEQQTGGNYVGDYTAAGYYAVFIRLYSGSPAFSPFAEGNLIHHNLILTYNGGQDQPPSNEDDITGCALIGYYYVTGGWTYNVMKAENTYGSVFYSNIYDQNPDMVDPDNEDFTLQETSPAINGGVVINDTNMTAAGWSSHPTGAPGNLTYNGSAPDIGAEESGSSPATLNGVSLTGVTKN